MPRRSAVALQFRAEAYDHPEGVVDGGTVMTWIDKAAYAAAASWSGTNVVAAYVGNMHFAHPVPVETRVTVQARVVHTGATTVHVQTRLVLPQPRGSAGQGAGAGPGATAPATAMDPAKPAPLVSTECVMVYSCVDETGSPARVRPWVPATPEQAERQRVAQIRSRMRREVEEVLSTAPHRGESTAEEIVLRFVANTRDLYPGESVQAGPVMRWIDEAAGVCAARWCGAQALAVFAGGVRFYNPVRVGDLVELEARLVHTGPRSMHVSVRARSGDKRSREAELVAHGLTVMVTLGEDGRAREVPQWTAVTEEDRLLEDRAVELVTLRNRSAHEWAAGESG